MEGADGEMIGRRCARVRQDVPFLAAAEGAIFRHNGVTFDVRLIAGHGAVRAEFVMVLLDLRHRRVIAELLEPIDRIEHFQTALKALIGGGDVRGSQDEDCAARDCEPPHSFPRADNNRDNNNERVLRKAPPSTQAQPGVIPARNRAGRQVYLASRSSNSMETPCGPRKKQILMPGRGLCGSLVNSTPLALSSAAMVSMPDTASPK